MIDDGVQNKASTTMSNKPTDILDESVTELLEHAGPSNLIRRMVLQ
jgi:hypothetical protein